MGLKVYGSPYTLVYSDGAFPVCKGKDSVHMWSKIPNDTDILITHGPPKGILDLTKKLKNVGCRELLQ